ncbi:MAG TPA: amidohydrolase family protein [Solirubrobacteraceae bacterium]|nr:amidohydrolase family protein [Solirubrobacteraceae bacterium]
MRIDVHQHLWTEPLVSALAARSELPFVRREHGLTVLFLAGERPYVIGAVGGEPAARAAQLEREGLDGALVCLSSPLGIERLPRAQSELLIDAFHDGASTLGPRFGVWGAIALEAAGPNDVDRALARGRVGVSLPAGALAGVEALARLRPVLERLEQREAPLLVHPGPGLHAARAGGGLPDSSLTDPLWWPALTRYVAQMQAAWLAFVALGRSAHPSLRVIFTMLAGLAPLQGERLRARGGRASSRGDRSIFYETSSYGPASVRRMAEVVGPDQLLYGSDRPVADPADSGMPGALDWSAIEDATRRALGDRGLAPSLGSRGGRRGREPALAR